MNSIGEVETKFEIISSKNNPFIFESGDSLDHVELAYETYGTLNNNKSNVILLFHALSGSQHAAGVNNNVKNVKFWTPECRLGWWNSFIGPKKALDTNKYFIICVNYLGGCYGSTGPSSIDPKTNNNYGSKFPRISVRDIVNSQIALLDKLNINNLLAVIGPSTGGLIAVNFATSFPKRVKIVIPIATGVKTTVLNRIILLEQILAIENDPNFNAGDYYEKSFPKKGLSLARMISHKNFVHLSAIERRAHNKIISTNDRLSWYNLHDHVESYMIHQGEKFTDRFDANTYLRICEMWSTYDPVIESKAKNTKELFSRSKESNHKYLIFSIDEDYCFYPEEQKNLVQYLKDSDVSNVYITVHSDKGHDSFLLEPKLYTPHIKDFLEQVQYI